VGDRAGHVLDGRHPAQHLLDGGGQPGPVGHQGLPLVGVDDHLEHAARQHVAGGLVATDQDQQRLVDEAVVVEAVAVDLGVDEGAHEVVAGLGPPGGHDAAGELGVGAERLRRLDHRRVLDVDPHQAPQQVVRPLHELGPVLGRHAEGVADHDQRQRGGDVPHEVARPPLAHGVDDLVAHPADLLLLVPHHAGREAPVDQLAALPVVGVVHVDHHRQGGGRRPDAARARPGVGRAGHVAEVVVPGDAPDLPPLVPVDGGVGPHPGQRGVGVVSPELAGHQVDGVVDGVVGDPSHGRRV
jgi:hypothetical protein